MAYNNNRNRRNKERIYNALENVKPDQKTYKSVMIQTVQEPFRKNGTYGSKVYSFNTLDSRIRNQWEFKRINDEILANNGIINL